MVRHEYSEIVSVVVAAWRVTQSAVERSPPPPLQKIKKPPKEKVHDELQRLNGNNLTRKIPTS